MSYYSLQNIESKKINIEKHSRLANEVTELKMERKSEVREAIYLRWSGG